MRGRDVAEQGGGLVGRMGLVMWENCYSIVFVGGFLSLHRSVLAYLPHDMCLLPHVICPFPRALTGPGPSSNRAACAQQGYSYTGLATM